MKLSEAILLGSVGSAQGQYNESMLTSSTHKCALGAALFAEGIIINRIDTDEPYSKVMDLWPWVRTHIEAPSALNGYVAPNDKYSVISLVWKLNDSIGWTRPQIAAWIAELEKTYDPTPITEVVCEVSGSAAS